MAHTSIMIDKRVVLKRMRVLYELALQEFSKHRELADRYAFLINKLALKNRVHIPSEIKIHLCRKCGKFLIPGKNQKVGTIKGSVFYECLECGYVYKKPFVLEQRERRRKKALIKKNF